MSDSDATSVDEIRPKHLWLAIMGDGPNIALSAVQQAAYDALLRSIISEVEYCCARARARRKRVDVLADLVDARLAVLSFLRLKAMERPKLAALLSVKTSNYVLTRRVDFGQTRIIGDEFV